MSVVKMDLFATMKDISKMNKNKQNSGLTFIIIKK